MQKYIGRSIPMVGKTYHRLFCIEDRYRYAGSQWRGWYRCACGVEKEIQNAHVRSGRTKSCGCWCIEGLTTHGQHNSREWASWKSMKQRCLNPNSTGYHNYGGRGIGVCSRWRDSFENFLDDMGKRPAGTSLDRIDNERGYGPSNCRWVTKKTQNNNRRTNRIFVLEGKRMTLQQVAEHYGVSKSKLWYRLSLGLSLEESVGLLLCTG